jgi:FlaA1/EpsC-like NDP-sugar epimerase
MKKILIIGSGGHAKVIASEILVQKKFEFIGFVDEKKKKNEVVFKYNNKNYYILGNLKSLKLKKLDKVCAIIGVGLNSKRKKILDYVKKLDINIMWTKVISKNSKLNNCDVGVGTFVGSGVILRLGVIV